MGSNCIQKSNYSISTTKVVGDRVQSGNRAIEILVQYIAAIKRKLCMVTNQHFHSHHYVEDFRMMWLR